jgi:hypothetical protein
MVARSGRTSISWSPRWPTPDTPGGSRAGAEIKGVYGLRARCSTGTNPAPWNCRWKRSFSAVKGAPSFSLQGSERDGSRQTRDISLSYARGGDAPKKMSIDIPVMAPPKPVSPAKRHAYRQRICLDQKAISF